MVPQGMATLSVIKDFNTLGNIPSWLPACLIVTPMNPLPFKGGEKTFGHGSSSVAVKSRRATRPPMESANGTVKTERVYTQRYQTRGEAKADLIEYLGYYNIERRHSALGYQSPAEFERQWWSQQPPGETPLTAKKIGMDRGEIACYKANMKAEFFPGPLCPLFGGKIRSLKECGGRVGSSWNTVLSGLRRH